MSLFEMGVQLSNILHNALEKKSPVLHDKTTKVQAFNCLPLVYGGNFSSMTPLCKAQFQVKKGLINTTYPPRNSQRRTFPCTFLSLLTLHQQLPFSHIIH